MPNNYANADGGFGGGGTGYGGSSGGCGSYTSGNSTTFSTSDWDNHGKVVITKQ